MKKTAYLYVDRDDSEYDYKAGFASYTDANDYRQECQRGWMNHCDYVYLWTGPRENKSHKNARRREKQTVETI